MRLSSVETIVSVCLSLSVSFCLFVCLSVSVCPSVCLSVRLSVSVCLSVRLSLSLSLRLCPWPWGARVGPPYLHVVAVGLPDVLVGVRLLVVVVGERRLARGRHAAEARLVEGLDVALQTDAGLALFKHKNRPIGQEGE